MKIDSALKDLKNGALHYNVWLHLGWVEVKQRYRRSIIGPWWISLSMLIFILMMGIVFRRLFNQSLEEYIPFFTTGFLFWTFISSSVIEATEIFKSNGSFIKQIHLPFSLYVFKHLVRQSIILAHNLIIYLMICVFFKLNPGWNVVLVVPGFCLLALNVFWVSFLVAMIAARFRDLVPMINSCVQIAFFMTPISWMPKLLEQNSRILNYNPLVYFLDVVRSPLLGHFPSIKSVYVSTILALFGCLFTFLLFVKTRSRIAFWVD